MLSERTKRPWRKAKARGATLGEDGGNLASGKGARSVLLSVREGHAPNRRISKARVMPRFRP